VPKVFFKNTPTSDINFCVIFSVMEPGAQKIHFIFEQSEPQGEAALAPMAPASIDIQYILKCQKMAKNPKFRKFVMFNEKSL
jgi:hypothetical protein